MSSSGKWWLFLPPFISIISSFSICLKSLILVVLWSASILHHDSLRHNIIFNAAISYIPAQIHDLGCSTPAHCLPSICWQSWDLGLWLYVQLHLHLKLLANSLVFDCLRSIFKSITKLVSRFEVEPLSHSFYISDLIDISIPQHTQHSQCTRHSFITCTPLHTHARPTRCIFLCHSTSLHLIGSQSRVSHSPQTKSISYNHNLSFWYSSSPISHLRLPTTLKFGSQSSQKPPFTQHKTTSPESEPCILRRLKTSLWSSERAVRR